LRPIRSLTASAVARGDGELDREVPELSRDELGQLARAFNTMAGKLRSYRDATVARVLRAQRAMEATLTSAPDPLFVVNRDGTQEVRNPAAQQLAALPEFVPGLPPSLAEPLA
jgi:nitrogen fixation/metabolism regulation signal transduction histidine kinase